MVASTPEEFADDLADSFQWRRSELASLKTEVERLNGDTEARPYGRMILRAAVALLYAHWEGFVKHGCQHYLDYVARRKLRYAELHPDFVATAVRSLSVNAGTDAGTMTLLAQLVAGDGKQRARVPRDGVVETGSNLRYARLCQILKSLGLSADDFETLEQLIDHRLCDARNDIAHGKYVIPTSEAVLELHTVVVTMMETVHTRLLDAVFNQEYRSA